MSIDSFLASVLSRPTLSAGVGRAGYGQRMKPSPLIVGTGMCLVLVLIVILIGGPAWAVAMGLVAVFLVLLLTFGTRA